MTDKSVGRGDAPGDEVGPEIADRIDILDVRGSNITESLCSHSVDEIAMEDADDSGSKLSSK